MNCTGVTFAKAIVNISTSIAQIFPLANVKGRKAIVSQVGTDATSYSTHCNGVEFTTLNWTKRMNNEDYKCIPTQVKRLIGFAKANGFTEKQPAFQDSRKNDNKRGISKVSQASKDDQEDEMMERAISKIANYYTKNDASSGDSGPVAPDANSS